MKVGLALVLICCFYNSSWASTPSCKHRCGNSFDSSQKCQCNTACKSYNDCCDDYFDLCITNSCKNQCDRDFDHQYPCQCDTKCQKFHNCCSDYEEECVSQDVTDNDIMELSEKLAALDQSKFFSLITMNYQNQVDIGGGDESNENLLFVDKFNKTVANHPTVKTLLPLYDNYNADVLLPENITLQEQQEENDFIDSVLETEVMVETYNFLNKIDVFKGSFDQFGDFLKQIWFDMYDRDGTSNVTLDSSGFEHVFIGEIKNGFVSGQHSWIRYFMLEQEKQINYHGYIGYKDFENFANIVTDVYDWNGKMKKIGGSFVGTTPEFDMAVFTVCYMTRGREEKECILSIKKQKVKIVSFPLEYNGKEHIGTSYPELI